jgi:hypothetical protein
MFRRTDSKNVLLYAAPAQRAKHEAGGALRVNEAHPAAGDPASKWSYRGRWNVRGVWGIKDGCALRYPRFRNRKSNLIERETHV